jgi:hypothetical protein
VRFRVYNSRHKIKTLIYEDAIDDKGENYFDKNLIELNIHSYFEIKIEVRLSPED